MKNQGCLVLAINSIEDHIHILLGLSRTVSLSKTVMVVKKSSSKWLKTQHPSLSQFAWQAGYGAFSVSDSRVPVVKNYTARQREHHRKDNFQNEFRTLLSRHHVTYDERYVWDRLFWPCEYTTPNLNKNTCAPA